MVSISVFGSRCDYGCFSTIVVIGNNFTSGFWLIAAGLSDCGAAVPPLTDSGVRTDVNIINSIVIGVRTAGSYRSVTASFVRAAVFLTHCGVGTDTGLIINIFIGMSTAASLVSTAANFVSVAVGRNIAATLYLCACHWYRVGWQCITLGQPQHGQRLHPGLVWRWVFKRHTS